MRRKEFLKGTRNALLLVSGVSGGWLLQKIGLNCLLKTFHGACALSDREQQSDPYDLMLETLKKTLHG